MNPIIALWAHQRARSTAFLRMMIERGDLFVIHEPLVTLFDEGEVFLPDLDGNQVAIYSEKELFDQMQRLAKVKPVFFKDTVEYRYSYLFKNPEVATDFIHTFIVRNPRPTVHSLYNMKPTFSRPEVGYEHLLEIFNYCESLSGKRPIVIDSDKLVEDPSGLVERYCKKVGLTFVPEALSWDPEDRSEWQRTQKWHVDVSKSKSFHTITNEYEFTIENTPKLERFHNYHLPFYEHLIRHAI